MYGIASQFRKRGVGIEFHHSFSRRLKGDQKSFLISKEENAKFRSVTRKKRVKEKNLKHVKIPS